MNEMPATVTGLMTKVVQPICDAKDKLSGYVFVPPHRMLAVSHFEPAHARKAFPCFDEPSFKASFTISIIHDPQLYALSNMPRARLVTRKDELVEEHFLPSVNMSTYLVAFAVVDFRYKEKMTSSGVLVCLTLS